MTATIQTPTPAARTGRHTYSVHGDTHPGMFAAAIYEGGVFVASLRGFWSVREARAAARTWISDSK